MNKGKLALLSFIWLISASVHAETLVPSTAPPRFGTQGQIAIAADMFLSATRDESQELTRISIIPTADYFVLSQLSVGGTLSFDYGHYPTSNYFGLGLGPRVGYNIELSDAFSLWPRAGIAWTHAVVSGTSADNVSVSIRREVITVSLFAPLLFHPAPHFFVGFGPFVNAQLNQGPGITSYGIRFSVGGWV
jgi:hypothetical protein